MIHTTYNFKNKIDSLFYLFEISFAKFSLLSHMQNAKFNLVCINIKIHAWRARYLKHVLTKHVC